MFVIVTEIPKYTKYRGGGGSNRESSSTYSGGDMGSEYTRTIKEINIPIKHDEELRSVNDQLKKIPSPWDNAGNTKPKVLERSSIVKRENICTNSMQ